MLHLGNIRDLGDAFSYTVRALVKSCGKTFFEVGVKVKVEVRAQTMCLWTTLSAQEPHPAGTSLGSLFPVTGNPKATAYKVLLICVLSNQQNFQH